MAAWLPNRITPNSFQITAAKGEERRTISWGRTTFSQLPPTLGKSTELAREKGSSSWLTVLPIESHGFSLHKGAFRDAIRDTDGNHYCYQKVVCVVNCLQWTTPWVVQQVVIQPYVTMRSLLNSWPRCSMMYVWSHTFNHSLVRICHMLLQIEKTLLDLISKHVVLGITATVCLFWCKDLQS